MPFVRRNRSAEDDLRLVEQESQLRHGKLRIGRDGLTVLTEHQESMARAAVRSVKPQRPKLPNEFTPLDGLPPGHGRDGSD